MGRAVLSYCTSQCSFSSLEVCGKCKRNVEPQIFLEPELCFYEVKHERGINSKFLEVVDVDGECSDQ